MKKVADKITEAELKNLQELVGKINEGQATIGSLELQKASVISAVSLVREELAKAQEELQKTYGDVNISLANGEITDASNQED